MKLSYFITFLWRKKNNCVKSTGEEKYQIYIYYRTFSNLRCFITSSPKQIGTFFLTFFNVQNMSSLNKSDLSSKECKINHKILYVLYVSIAYVIWINLEFLYFIETRSKRRLLRRYQKISWWVTMYFLKCQTKSLSRRRRQQSFDLQSFKSQKFNISMDKIFLIAKLGNAWTCKNLHGLAMDLHGLAWSAMVSHGLPWSCMVLHGLAWTCMDLHGLEWTRMDMLGLIHIALH